MGIFGKKKKTDDVKNSAELQAESEDLLFKALLSGEEVTRDMAMSIPAVSKNVEKISNMFASVPFKLYKEEITEDGKKKTVEVPGDKRVELINDETGDKLDGFQFKKALCADYLMGKGGYAYIQRRSNTVTGLFYVDEGRISFLSNSDPIFKTYNIQVNGKNYNDFQFIKLLRNTKNGYSGNGITKEINKILQSAFELLKLQLKLSKTGGAKKGFLKSAHKLQKEAIESLKEAWNNLYSDGTENVVILNDGVEFIEASSSATEMQLNQTRVSLSKEIDDVFQNSNDDKLFFKYAVSPIIKAFETALNRDLLLESEKGSFYFAADTKELLKASTKERYEAYKIAKETGFLTLNEIRYLEDLEEVDGLDVIAMSLGNVLLNTNTGVWSVPNTGQTFDEGGEQ